MDLIMMDIINKETRHKLFSIAFPKDKSIEEMCNTLNLIVKEQYEIIQTPISF